MRSCGARSYSPQPFPKADFTLERDVAFLQEREANAIWYARATRMPYSKVPQEQP